MKAIAVLSLLLTLRFCSSLPLSKENVPERSKTSETVQSDSIPVALLLVIPPTLPQFRDDGEDTQEGEDLSFIEDHLINLLLRDAEIPFQEEDFKKDAQNEKSLLLIEDIKALKPLLRENGENVDVAFVVEEPVLLSKDIVESNFPQTREDDKDFKESGLPGERLPYSDNNILNALALSEDIEFRLVPEESLPIPENSVQNLKDDESIFQGTKPVNDRPLERSYENVEYLPAEKSTPKPAEQVVATFPEAPESAVPILLDCAPKVEKGHLAEATLAYKSHDLKARKSLDELKNDNVKDFKDGEFNAKNSDVLDLNSPASIITVDRLKRHTLPKAGVTHYKVSEDFPESSKGNHHLVSADYPEPNMVKVTALKDVN